jgi:capsular exopolysaccharide synthesis family protein
MEPTEYSEQIDFQKYWLVLKRRWLPATAVFGIIVGLATLAAFSQKPIYQGEGKLLLKVDRSSSLTGLKNEIGEMAPIGEKTNPLSTEAEIISSLPIAQKTVQALDLRDKKGKFIDATSFAKSYQVKPVTGTDILAISYQDNNPKMAAAVVNKIMEVYLQDNILNNRAKATAAREFIVKQLPTVEATVSQADVALRKFKEDNKVIALEEEASKAVEVMSILDTRISQTQASLADATAKSTSLRNQIGLNSQEAVAVTSLSQSPGIQEVLKKLQEVQSQLAIERTRFLDTAPTVTSLQQKEEALKALLQGRVDQSLGTQQQVPRDNLQNGELKQKLTADLVESEAERSGWADQLTVLYNAQAAYKKRSSIMPQLEQTQRELERRVKVSQTTYETLLNKLQEAQVAENQNIGNARVVATAVVPNKPSGPSKKKYLIGGILGGTMLSVATAFLLDLVDKSVKTLKEAKELFGATLLGVIPAFGKSGKTRRPVGDLEGIVSRMVARDMPRSPMGQAYQMLQANLKFLSSDKQLKAIVITSSVPKEGKSEVSANLAAAMAQVGRKVLLVDADMRHPSQHHLWELTNSVGLSNVLVGEADFNIAVQKVMPGLDILPAGVIPPNPVALLDSKRMASLMETFSKNYDFVIVDTPPLAGIADAPIVGKMADGILLVVRPGVVDSASAKAAKEFLASSGQNVLGLVANGVLIKNEPDSYFYYVNEEYTTPPGSASQEQARHGIGGEARRS